MDLRNIFRWFPIFFLTAVGLISINLVWLIPTIGNIRSSASLLAVEVLDRIHSEVYAYLKQAEQSLAAVVEEVSLEPEDSNIIFARFLRRNPGFNNIALVTVDGLEVLRADKFNPLVYEEPRNHSEEFYFRAARENISSFGKVFIFSGNEPHAIIAVPVIHSGAVKGVLVADLNLRRLVLITRSLKFQTGHIYILDEKGNQIIHPNPEEILKTPNFLNRLVVRKILIEGKVATGLAPEDSYTNEEGIATFTVGRPVNMGHMGIFFEQPRTNALAGERQVILFAFATIILGMLILFLLIRGNARLISLNFKLQGLLQELDMVGKILVRRDLELSQANERLKEIDQIKTEFVSVAAHQLRTPLTGIKWALSSTLEEMKNIRVEDRKVIEDAFRATSRLADLINDLLNVARIEEGRFGFHLRLQSIPPLLQEIVSQSQRFCSEKGITLNLQADEEDIPKLLFDKEKISIVMDNLIDNAKKYTSPGGIIAVRVRRDGARVIVSVKDTGIGIPTGQAYRIFSKFFRSSNAQLFQTSGTGLGLYVSKNIIEQHMGSIWFESEEGKGTTFNFSLPVPEEKPDDKVNKIRPTA